MSQYAHMASTFVCEPFHRPGWVYEEKYDGDEDAFLSNEEASSDRDKETVLLLSDDGEYGVAEVSLDSVARLG